MLVLVSPAKTLDYESDMSVSDFSVASHLSDSQLLVKELQKKNPEDLASLMGLSEKLSFLNFERNMNWSKPTKPTNTARQLYTPLKEMFIKDLMQTLFQKLILIMLRRIFVSCQAYMEF